MRKFISFMVAATAIFGAVSCNKELPQDEQVPAGEKVVFTATVDGADTKAVLTDTNTDNPYSVWSGEELITIHDGNQGFTFYTNAQEPSATAEFSYEGDDFTATNVMAVYPSGGYSANIGDKTVSGIVIPDYQTLVDGTYPATAAVAVAYSENRSLVFKNAVTLLKFKVADEGITYGAFYADNGSGNLTGTYTLDYNDGNPALTATEAKQWVDFSLENGAEFSTEATYYIAVAPASFATGFAISLNGMEIKKYNGAYDLKRNVILDLGTLELPEASQNWSVCGTINEWGDTDMTLEGDWYVAKNLTITTADRFKFRADHDWGQNRGTDALVSENAEYDVTQNGSDIYVSVSAIYNVYLSKDTNKMKVVKVGEYVDPNPDPEPETGTTIYLNTGGSSLWDQANAYFEAWVWGAGDKWVKFAATNESGIYSTVVPTGTTGMKILRKGPEHASNSWTQWNNTNDITLNGNNYITITGWGESDWTLSKK